MGRTAKPRPKVAKEASVAANGETFGKKTLLKTIAAEAPKRKKSYHSRIEPTTLAAAVRRCGGAALPGAGAHRRLRSGPWWAF
ncbi:hypothetical protein [Streptomyces sp. NPDC056982]|uniref:hypothetical protein n=1 Tax=Streptomyces sp. NPDC056982 TaxID=3345986 RepID=UPI003627CA2B